jgi:L-threonylcarbamoyladenylate synthase
MSLFFSPPLILRPGGITLEQLRQYIPKIEVYNKNIHDKELAQKPPTPGLKYKHYSPNAEVILFEGSTDKMQSLLLTQIEKLLKENKKIGLIHTRPTSIQIPESIKTSSQLILKQLGSESEPGENNKLCSERRYNK